MLNNKFVPIAPPEERSKNDNSISFKVLSEQWNAMATNEIFTSPPQWNDSFPDDRIAHLVGGVMRTFGRRCKPGWQHTACRSAIDHL